MPRRAQISSASAGWARPLKTFSGPYKRADYSERPPRIAADSPCYDSTTRRPSMIPSIQTLILIAAGVALFRLWRATQPSERWLQLVVAAGFLSRAILGQILFWISWGRLPIARGLQLGNGLWFFAPDASDYFHTALATAEKGLWAIVTFDHAWPSATYVQTLALSVWLFGRTPSVSVLLNLFCYL